jgi:hypothetical protein
MIEVRERHNGWWIIRVVSEKTQIPLAGPYTSREVAELAAKGYTK